MILSQSELTAALAKPQKKSKCFYFIGSQRFEGKVKARQAGKFDKPQRRSYGRKMQNKACTNPRYNSLDQVTAYLV